MTQRFPARLTVLAPLAATVAALSMAACNPAEREPEPVVDTPTNAETGPSMDPATNGAVADVTTEAEIPPVTNGTPPDPNAPIQTTPPPPADAGN